MTMGLGYFFGGTFLILYGIMCYYIGAKKPPTLFRITKLKLGGKMADETVVKVCYAFGTFAIIAAFVVFYIGFTR